MAYAVYRRTPKIGIRTSAFHLRILTSLAAVWVTILVLLMPAQASVIGATDSADIRAVIEAQIDAFKRDDAKAAYGLAAPSIQSTFSSK